MPKPSDADLNAAMAKALGWKEVSPPENWEGFESCWEQPDGEFYGDEPPDFCSPDCPHSLTAQVLAKVEDAGKFWDYLPYLHQQTGSKMNVLDWPLILKLTPSQQTEAALRALSLWEWED